MLQTNDINSDQTLLRPTYQEDNYKTGNNVTNSQLLTFL